MLNKEGHKVMNNMMEEYGRRKGKEVFHATMNKRDMGEKWENKKSGYSKGVVERASMMRHK